MAASAGLARSLVIQRRVIGALLMREVITRFGRRNIGVLWLIGEPMLFTLGVTALWVGGNLHVLTNVPIVAFAITGYSSVLLWRNTVTHGASGIQQNVPLLYHRNVRVVDVMITRVLVELAGATASFIILAVMFTAFGMASPPDDPLLVVAGWLMLAWFGCALAFVVGGAASYSEVVERLWHPAAYLLFPLSGAAFMVDWLPPAAQSVVLLVPMVHGVEMVREGYFGDVVRAHYSVAYMGSANLLLTLLGLALVQKAGRVVESK